MHYSVLLYVSHSEMNFGQGFILDSSPHWHRTARSAVLLGLANKERRSRRFKSPTHAIVIRVARIMLPIIASL